ncbi:MAG: transporter [Marinilabiliaceae bacterium]|nr:transporter [Marinilabiliaceae bacterium]
MLVGVFVYLAFAHLTPLQVIKPYVKEIDIFLTPSLIFVQLLLTFCKVNPRDFRFRGWHFILLGFQLFCSLICALVCIFYDFHPLLAQGAMVCLICPTATAAAVITAKLGGCAETLITYTFLVNILAAIFVPLVFPLVYEQELLSFWMAFWIILRKVFPLLICPFLLAQILRWLLPSVHGWLRSHASLAFYIWAIALAMVMGKTAKSIVDDSEQLHIVVLLALVSLCCCIVQFAFGKRIGSYYGDRLSAGQAIGQKNTVLAIWMAYTYLPPITSVAPGAYVLWQNIINSWQLWKKRKRES